MLIALLYSIAVPSQHSDSNVKYIYVVFTILIRASSIFFFMKAKRKRSVVSNHPINLRLNIFLKKFSSQSIDGWSPSSLQSLNLLTLLANSLRREEVLMCKEMIFFNLCKHISAFWYFGSISSIFKGYFLLMLIDHIFIYRIEIWAWNRCKKLLWYQFVFTA